MIMDISWQLHDLIFSSTLTSLILCSSLERTRCFTWRQKQKLVLQVNVHPCVDCAASYKIKVCVCVANFFTLGIWLLFFCLLEQYSWEDTLWPLFSVFLAKYDVEAESKKQGTFRDTFWCRQTSNCGHFSGISVPDIPGRCYEFLSCLTHTWFNWLIVIIIYLLQLFQFPLHVKGVVSFLKLTFSIKRRTVN